MHPTATTAVLPCCDQCVAPARVRFTHVLTGYDLVFCGHHASEHEDVPGFELFACDADHRVALSATR